MTIVPILKPKTFRSEAYLEFICSKPCLRCGNPLTVAHHEPMGKAGMKLKAPDSHTVPLCVVCHDLKHWQSFDVFWENVDIKMKIIEYLTEYLQRLQQEGQV